MRPEEITRWAEVRLTPKRWEATCSVPTADGMATKIADVSRVAYAGKVYNLHVDEDESFVVGCIAVHNCWFASRLAWQSGTGNGEVTLRVIG